MNERLAEIKARKHRWAWQATEDIGWLIERLEQAGQENASLRVLLREEYMARLNFPTEGREQDVAAIDARIAEALAAYQREA